MRFRPALAAFAAFLICIPVFGVVRKADPSFDHRILDPGRASGQSERLDPAEPSPVGRAARSFLSRRGGQWEFSVDRRTGRPTLVQGSGVPMIPGRGNKLTQESIEHLPLPDGDVTLETLEPLARDFIAQHADLLAPPSGQLVLDPAVSLTRDNGRLTSLYFDWYVDGVRVEEARVFLRLNSGNLTQFGTAFVGPIRIHTRPGLDAAQAVQALLEYSGDEELAQLDGEPELIIQAEDGPGRIDYRLVWKITYRIPGRIELWEGRLDARSGQVVSFRDTTAYGRVQGGVFPRTVVDTEVLAPFGHADVLIDGTPVTADISGHFDYTGGEAVCGLSGAYFNTACLDGCTNPAATSISFTTGNGIVDLGMAGGPDWVGNGLSNRAERNAFYHMNEARRVAKIWLPSLAWLDTNITTNVNIDSNCNAGWNGTANFFTSGGGCNNTGEISDVVHHEWGHGLDLNTNAGDGGTGEGTGDVTGIQFSHSPLIGPYFNVNGNPVRNVDQFTSGRGLLTLSNLNVKCGGAIHCIGEIYGQTHWDLSQALAAKHGHHTGWRTLDRIFFTSLPDADTYNPVGPDSIYDAYILADDDDGNLANGTPNGDEIFQAFDLHEIAGTQRVSSPACTRPVQPAVTPTIDCDSVDLSWDAVPGIDHYEILRAELRQDTAYYAVATVASTETSYDDTEVAPGVDYYYVVMAVDGAGCESTVENPVLVNLPAQPLLSVTAATADDTPAGNRSGFPDPGEEVDLSIIMKNFGELDASVIGATLTPVTPGVTIVDGSDTWPDLTVGSSGANQGVLRFASDEMQVDCGQKVRFKLDVTDASICLSEDSYLDVRMGDRFGVFVDDFEANIGWAHDATNSTATSGDWIWGDPEGTGFQPEDDATPDPGQNCWFTASNPGGSAGTDDVDGGVVILTSPIVDMSGETDIVLSYQRWFANRDVGEDSGDFFTADVSSNGGTDWVNLETLDFTQTAPTWTLKEFKLQDFVTLTDQMRLRFQASDGAATGNLIEAAIDDVRFDRPECDDTPACFVEPTFAGLESAGPGSSCGEVQLGWQAASSNCTNAVITYDIYRSATPGFTPEPGNLLAQGLSGTTFEDTLLNPGQTYYYVVRANDSRSGQDSNTVELGGAAQITPDTKAPIFSGLGSVGTGAGCGDTVLSWSPAVETCSAPVAYEIYRSTDPGFVPTPADRIGSTTSLSFADVTVTPGASYTYIVRARDDVGNEEGNEVRLSGSSGLIDEILVAADFESGAAGFATATPNNASTGEWELGDPEGTSAQPEDDVTDPGVNAWITGLLAGADAAANDVDSGTTTIRSAVYDLSAEVDPVLRYSRWYFNDQNDFADTFRVELSTNGGTGGGGWTTVETVNATTAGWVEVEFDLNTIVTPTDSMRFRFQAVESGASSILEAGLDDFEIVDRDQGCQGCALPVNTVGTVLLSASGDDVVLDWTSDPVVGTRFAVYRLTGPTLDDAVRIGTTDGRTFVHEGAVSSAQAFNYRVTAIDVCGNESVLP